MSKLYCGNCGKNGHSYKICLSPIISLGVILFREKEQSIQFLMVQRRDTLGFVEFMRGKYSLDNTSYIKELLKIMTRTERDLLVSLSFDELWDKLWMEKNSKYNYSEYNISKKKFNLLSEGVGKDKKTLSTLNTEVEYVYEEPEWGFPKGRRNLYEQDIDCARREFSEETGISGKYYELIDCNRIYETFKGSNGIRYRHIYYIARLVGEPEIGINPENKNQVTEISNVKWFNFSEAIFNIRPYNTEKRDVLKKVHGILQKKINNK